MKDLPAGTGEEPKEGTEPKDSGQERIAANLLPTASQLFADTQNKFYWKGAGDMGGVILTSLKVITELIETVTLKLPTLDNEQKAYQRGFLDALKSLTPLINDLSKTDDPTKRLMVEE
jgi:hypothetical protein